MISRHAAWTSIALLALSAPLAGCDLHGRPKLERKASAASPSTAAPAPAAVPPPEAPGPEVVVAPGIVEPWGDSVDVSALESGSIAEIAVKEGQEVAAGQLLARLDDATQRSAVELARAELAEAEAVLAKVERGATPEELQQAQAEYDAAKARSDLARSSADRTARLHSHEAVPDAEAERAADEARVEAAREEGAEARLAEVERGPRAEDRSAARARTAAARARLTLAETSLARRRVLAPATGEVLLGRFHAGEFYAVTSSPMFVLGDLTRLQVRLEVDEIDARDVSAGAACAVYSDGGARLATGTVVRLVPKMGRRALAIESPTARADVRVREVLVEIPAASKLIPGERVWGHTPRGASGRIASRRMDVRQ